MLGKTCTWCDLPAVGEVEVQPAVYIRRSDVLKQRAIVVPACDDHIAVPSQPNVQVDTRRRHARGVVQLDIFGGEAGKPRDAIRGQE